MDKLLTYMVKRWDLIGAPGSSGQQPIWNTKTLKVPACIFLVVVPISACHGSQNAEPGRGTASNQRGVQHM